MNCPEPKQAPASAPDLDLIRKYSAAGPRYTSYPPATRFTTRLTAAEVDRDIRADNAPGAGPLSLYFHLPFCETLCWYCGCNTVITRRRNAAAEYLDDLTRELFLTLRRLDCGRRVTQIHLGGGTPTFLRPEDLARLGLLIIQGFKVDSACEFGVEIDPRRLTRDHVEALGAIGANRASLGIQDTDPRVQAAINRRQPSHLNRQAMAWLRQGGFGSVNIDLIYGLPLQTIASFGRTIDEVLDLAPDRLSLFAYAHVPWVKPAQRIFDRRGQLPPPAARLELFEMAHARLVAAGFVHIGLDHFARPGDELAVAQRDGTLHRNFQGYSTRSGASLYGFGVSSISATVGGYRQNCKDLSAWRAALSAGRLPVERGLILTEDDRRRRAFIMALMCNRRVDYQQLSLELGIDVAAHFLPEISSLDDLEADGIVARTETGIEVRPAGVPILRVIAMRFDATLIRLGQSHSQVI